MVAKYGVSRGGWDSSGPSYCFSWIWKGIMSVKESFEAIIKLQLGDGNRVLFWIDIWMASLASQFSSLFACTRDWPAKACDYMVLNEDLIQWGLIFRRDLTDIEEGELYSLLDVLD